MNKNYSKVIFVCLLIAVVLAFAAPVFAEIWHVYPADSIQAAVDGASDGDRIYVYEGTYNEPIMIDGKNLTLIAIGTVTIAPATCTAHNDAITVYNGNVTIIGFSVDATNCMSGIYARGGYGVGPVSLTALNNHVSNFYKNGITVNGYEASGHITDNTVIGLGPVGYIAQNGIQFGYGAKGTVMRNTVNLSWYTGENWTAAGILLFEADDVVVQLNTVENCQTGIAVEAWCWYLPSANNNKIVENTIMESEYGVSVAAYAWTYSTCDPSADNNKVVHNVITNSNGGDIGIFMGVGQDSADYTANAYNNKAIRNKVLGFITPIEEAGTATKVRANIYD